MSVVGTQALRRRLLDPADDFNISPLPDWENVQLGSIDLGLGGTFLVAHRAAVTALRAADAASIDKLFTEVRVGPDAEMVIQPQQFVLSSTREYLCMPHDLCGIIESRSTYGRLGLIAATATFVTAGYKGCPTLEIVNAGEAPVVITPGERICQLIVMTTDEAEEDLRPSRYQCAVRPFPSRTQTRRY